jgi:hypothetical protein
MLTLFSPSGAAVGSTLHSNSQADFALSETGTYVIRVNASDLGTKGSYNLGLECLFPAQSPDTVTLVCGSLNSKVVDAAAQVDLYRFEGGMGQTVTLTLASTGGFSANPNTGFGPNAMLTLFSPSGAAVGSTLHSNSQRDFALSETGIYVIRVNASDFSTKGSYIVSLQCF